MATNETPSEVSARLRNLDNPLLIGIVYILSMALLTYGEIHSSVPYTDPSFVIEYFGTELQVAALFILATLIFFDRKRIGLTMPVFEKGKLLVPLLLVTGAGLASWIVGFFSLPAGVEYDFMSALTVWRTTAVVGFTEEWMYRGLLLVFFTRRFGMKNGSFTAMLFFGILHLINIVGGVPPSASIFQFFNTMILGSVFILAAIGTRSLLFPIICHGLYDLVVMESSKMSALGSSPYIGLITIVITLPVGIYSVMKIYRFEGKGNEPFISREA
jgi:membrane protease YdiL (CAAX protease family)